MSNAVDTGPLRGYGLSGHTQVSLAGLSTRNLSIDELKYGMIELTGALTADVSVVWPNFDGYRRECWNNTTGDQLVTCKVSGQAGTQVPQGRQISVWCNGADIKPCFTANGERSAIVSISAAGGDVTLTPTQAAAGMVKATSAAADFALIFPLYCLDLTDTVTVFNSTSFNMTCKLGSGDTGVLVPSFAFQRLSAHPNGLFITHHLGTDGVAHYSPYDIALGGGLAGVNHGLCFRSASRSISGNVTLTNVQNQSYFLKITGTLSADATITFSGQPGAQQQSWCVHNATTGGFNIVCKVVSDAGAGVTIAAAKKAIINSTGTAMERVTADVTP